MRYLDEVRKPRNFTQLCLLADKEEWCWNICCGTCGHQNFVKSLLLLINEAESYPFYGRDMRDLLSSKAYKV